MRIVRNTFRVLLVLLVAAVVAAGVYALRTFPTLDGELRVAGLTAPVLVRRDASDVTHIEGQSLGDTFFGMGYVHAQERSWQLEFNRRVINGTLSEAFGPTTVDTDKLLRRLGIQRAAQAQWERLPADARSLLQAYANGINAFHRDSGQALPPEFHLTGVRPGEWTPQDSLGWALMMALDLGGNWRTEFARLSLLQQIDTARLWQLIPPYPGEAPTTSVDLAALYRGLGVYRAPGTAPAPAKTAAGPLDEWMRGLGHTEGIGSNNWVVAGNRTDTGKPLLANDPHLGLSAPAIWYFARLRAPAAGGAPALDVMGATLPGLPSVVLGRTAKVAWAFTNTGPDVQDLYLEQINPANPRQYRTPTGWADFVAREEVIRVKGKPDVKFTVLQTRHGPVLSNDDPGYSQVIDTSRYALALRWAALDADNTTVLAGLRANLAQSVDEIVNAFGDYHSPMQNLVAADTSGKTVYRAIGRVPVRAGDNDLRGVAPAPGWEAKYDWAGWLPSSQNPTVAHAAIEAKGWHATANQRIHAKDYPHFLTGDWEPPARYDRIESLLARSPRHNAQSLRAVQADTLSLSTQRLLPLLQSTTSDHPQAAAALAQLKSFNADMRAESPAALVFAVWADELTRGVIAPKVGEERFKSLFGKRSFRAGLEAIAGNADAAAWWCAPLSCAQQSSQALTRALERIAREQGSDVAAWRWGQMHQAVSGHRPFGNVDLLARFFDVRVPTGGDGWTVNVGQYWTNDAKTPFANRHAASLRAIYDLADLEKSQFIYQTGQSGLVFSPRYRDMSEQWAQVQYRPLKMNPGTWKHQATLVPAK